MDISNKVFVVTGAGSGIGRALALALLSGGAKVCAIDLRPEGLEELKQKSGEHSSALHTQTLDITDRAAVMTMPQKTIDALGQVDALINCAGIIQPFVKVNDLDYDAIERVMNVNFYGAIYMTKSYLPHLLKRPEAYIVNVSSMGGFLPVPGQSIYGASKAALKLMTEGLYAELLETPVHVSIVYPGATDTNITANSNVKAPAIPGSNQKVRSLSASEAAKIIVEGIKKNKPQIFTGSDSKFMNKLYRLNPVFATRFIAKKMKSLLSGA